MQSILAISFVGICLSLDAFSLSLLYGTLNLSKKKMILLSIVVGIYHFFMPIIGSLIGHIIVIHLLLLPKHIVAIIFIFIAIEMIISVFKEETLIVLDFIGILLFGLAVSVDSFLTGIGLSILNNNILQCSFIFSIFSSSFTYVGLRIGGKISQKYGKCSSIVGGILLIIVAICYLTK
jgi:putative Mn2+ efflux pump MntP